MFVHYNDRVVNTDKIDHIDAYGLVQFGSVYVYYRDGGMESVNGPEAFNLVIRLCPPALEGKRAKYVRHAWAIHNLIGHPLMQIFSWLGFPRLGIKIHDITTPLPITK